MADVTIEVAAKNTLWNMAVRGGVFWTSPTTGYVIYINDSSDLVYRKTTNGGAAWGGAVNIKTGTIINFDSWADWQTEGDAGTKIHIAYIDADANDVHYVYLDTSGDSVGGDDQIEACQGTGAIYTVVRWDYVLISITKTRGGNFAVALHYRDSDQVHFYSFYTSPDATTWTSEASPWEAAGDFILLFPGNEVDNQDVWAAFWDGSANAISLKTYDDSGDSWSEQAFSGLMIDHPYHLQMDGQVRLTDGHLIFAAWSRFDNLTSDLMVWDINGAGSITAKTNIITDTAEYALVSVFINQVNDDIYVAYVGGTDMGNFVKAFYQKSVDGGANWGGQEALQADAEDDERWISAGAMKAAWGGKFQPFWFNIDLHDLFTNTNNGILIEAAGEEAFQLSITDLISMGDSSLKSMLAGLSIDDGFKSGDTNNPFGMISRADGLEIGDSHSILASLLASDSLKVGDTPLYNLIWYLITTDGIRLGDSTLVNLILPLIVTDGTKLGDSLSLLAKLIISDGLEFGDSRSVEMLANLLQSDGVKLGDSTTYGEAILYLAIVEGLKAGDTHLIEMLADIQTSDGTKVGDSSLIGMLTSLLSADGLEVGDSTSSLVDILPAVIDRLKIGDSRLLEALMSLSHTDGVKLGTVANIYISLIGRLLRMWLSTKTYHNVSMFTEPYHCVTIRTGGEDMIRRDWQRGETVPIWAEVKLTSNGALYDPEAIILYLYDEADATIVDGEAMVYDSQGMYVYYHQTAIDAILGWYRAKGKVTDGSGETLRVTLENGGFNLQV